MNYLENVNDEPLNVQVIAPRRTISKSIHKSTITTTPDDVKSALKFIDPDCDYSLWSKYISAGRLQGEEYFEVFDQWSSNGKKYRGTKDVRRTWVSFEHDIDVINKSGKNPVTILSVFKEATKNGWIRNPELNFCKLKDANIYTEVVEKIYQPISFLKVNSMAGFSGDHYMDAVFIINTVFGGCLVNLDGVLHYFNGRFHEKVTDQIVRRLITRAMGGGDVKVTQNRISGTLAVIKDQALELGEANTVSSNVYFTNCVLNAETGELSSHDIENCNTSTLSVEYQSNSKCPQFISFLSSTFSNDSGRIQLLQELIGWILFRDNIGIEKAALFIGPPRAGKGVLARLIFTLLGSGAVPFNLSELDDNKRLSGMRQANVAIDTDAIGSSNRNARAVMGLFKIITSNEKLSVLQLYKQTPWEGVLNCKMFVLANSVPSMWDDSSATANRWIPLVFDHSFLGKEDPNLYKRLSTELTGIATWAVDGLRRLIVRGHFELPQSSLNQLESLVSDSGPMQEFISDCLILGEQQRSSDRALWNSYQMWATGSGREVNKRHHMLKSLEDALRGNDVRRTKSVKLPDGKFHRGFYGVGVKCAVQSMNVTPFIAPAN